MEFAILPQKPRQKTRQKTMEQTEPEPSSSRKPYKIQEVFKLLTKKLLRINDTSRAAADARASLVSLLLLYCYWLRHSCKCAKIDIPFVYISYTRSAFRIGVADVSYMREGWKKWYAVYIGFYRISCTRSAVWPIIRASFGEGGPSLAKISRNYAIYRGLYRKRNNMFKHTAYIATAILLNRKKNNESKIRS